MATIRVLASVCCAFLVASCASAPPASRTSSTAAVAPTSSPAPASPPKAARDFDVAVEVRAPMHARYDPNIGGAAKPTLGVVVTNRSAQPLDVSDLRVHLEAAREGVAFRCAKELGAQMGDREPSVLAPGQSYMFDRNLDCALPLVGAYSIRVAVSFGSGPARIPREVSAFNLTVTALPNIEPREIEGLPGLWASMGASNKLAGGVDRGYGHTLLTIVNSSRKPIEVPRMHLALRVYRVGNPIPCEDQPLVIGTPPVLGPGETYTEPIVVSCVGLAKAGAYDIAARLVVPRGTEGDREIALGKVRVVVVLDPTIIVPPVYPP
jgi:hypothetical protein